jgi:hypothetical protein
MKANPNIRIENIASRWVLLNTEDGIVSFSDLFELNETGRQLWLLMEQTGFTVESAANWIVNNFPDISEEQAKADAEDFLDKLSQRQLIQ